MSDSKPTPRILQQQPPREGDEQQRQRAGKEEFQPKAGQENPQQMGEGSYEASRDYKERTEEYLKKADVEADAQAAKPRSAQEAKDLEEAEREGRSHSKGER
jgi:hypothetical protein